MTKTKTSGRFEAITYAIEGKTGLDNEILGTDSKVDPNIETDFQDCTIMLSK